MRSWLILILLSGCITDVPPLVVEPDGPDPDLAIRAAPQPRFDNTPACRAFVEHVNGLSCVPETARLDAALVCARAQQDVPCDAAAWWDCATRHTTCDGAVLRRTGVAACPGPCLTVAEVAP